MTSIATLFDELHAQNCWIIRNQWGFVWHIIDACGYAFNFANRFYTTPWAAAIHARMMGLHVRFDDQPGGLFQSMLWRGLDEPVDEVNA